MAIFRPYMVDSKGVSISGTTAVPILYFSPTSTNDANLCKIKVAVEAATSPTPPSNGSILFTVNLVTGTVGGGGAVTAQPTGPSTLAANTTFTSANAAAITGLTQSTEYWAQPIPLTSGSWGADDFENTGFELNVPASGKYCVYYIAASGAGTGLNARAMIWFAE